jgi:hypothetical protein
MKCICINDVIMEETCNREFTRGVIYHGNGNALTDDHGYDNHIVIFDDNSFFNEHFIQLESDHDIA